MTAHHLAVVVRSQEYLILDLDRQHPVKGLGYGWECLICHAAEAAHFATEVEAGAAADWHQERPEPAPTQRHEVAITSSRTNRVLLDGHAGLAGQAIASLGYGWECLTCHRAEAAHFPSAPLAKEAADRHAAARPGDLMSVTDLLAKLDALGTVIGVLDHETKPTRAFVIVLSFLFHPPEMTTGPWKGLQDAWGLRITGHSQSAAGRVGGSHGSSVEPTADIPG